MICLCMGIIVYMFYIHMSIDGICCLWPHHHFQACQRDTLALAARAQLALYPAMLHVEFDSLQDIQLYTLLGDCWWLN